jgi:uncharacterized damage-inducible protein DinB
VDAAYFRKLFAYNRWANDRVLEQAMALPVENYTAKVAGLSFETLHATLTHVFVADAVWLGRWKARPLTGDLADARRMDRVVETEVPTLRILLERWRAMESDRQEYLASLSDEDVRRPIAYQSQNGTTYLHPLGEQMAHVINHGTQFRAEAAVALTAFGSSPGDMDLIAYLRQLDTA